MFFFFAFYFIQPTSVVLFPTVFYCAATFRENPFWVDVIINSFSFPRACHDVPATFVSRTAENIDPIFFFGGGGHSILK